MELRPYQTAIIQASRTLLAAGPVGCLVAPTGAGKTVIFSAMAKMVIDKTNNQQQPQVLILVNRIGLLTQTIDKLKAFGIKYCIIHKQNIRMTAPVVLSTIGTFSKRYPDGVKLPLTIVDECHIAVFDKYVKTQIAAGGRVLGFTATPGRLDRKKSMVKTYQQFAQPAKTHELIEGGYLVQPRYKVVAIDLSKLELGDNGEYTDASQERTFANVESLVNGVIEHSLGKALIFCTRVEKSYEIAAALTAANHPAEAIHGGMHDNERKRLIALLRCGAIKALVNADLLTFGFDMPELNTVVPFRATTSLPLWHQMVGRGARLYDGKTQFIVLDFGRNAERLGLWEEDIQWALHFDPPPKVEQTPAVKICKPCGAMNVLAAKKCKECGAEFPKPESGMVGGVKTETDMVLVDYSGGRLAQIPVDQMPASELIKVAEDRGYKKSWIHYILAKRPEPVQELAAYFAVIGKPDPISSANKVLARMATTHN